MEHVDRHWDSADGDADAAANETIVSAAMLVATVVSMWALSAMAVTVRHGRSRMARWAQQQQHNDLYPAPSSQSSTSTQTAAALQVTASMVTTSTNDRLHDPGGGLSKSTSTLQVGVDGQQQHHREKANSLLRIVESQQNLGDNCTAGTDLNMGEGVVDRYAQVHRQFHPIHTSCLLKNTKCLPSLSKTKSYY